MSSSQLLPNLAVNRLSAVNVLAQKLESGISDHDARLDELEKDVNELEKKLEENEREEESHLELSFNGNSTVIDQNKVAVTLLKLGSLNKEIYDHLSVVDGLGIGDTQAETKEANEANRAKYLKLMTWNKENVEASNVIKSLEAEGQTIVASYFQDLSEENNTFVSEDATGGIFSMSTTAHFSNRNRTILKQNEDFNLATKDLDKAGAEKFALMTSDQLEALNLNMGGNQCVLYETLGMNEATPVSTTSSFRNIKYFRTTEKTSEVSYLNIPNDDNDLVTLVEVYSIAKSNLSKFLRDMGEAVGEVLLKLPNSIYGTLVYTEDKHESSSSSNMEIMVVNVMNAAEVTLEVNKGSVLSHYIENVVQKLSEIILKTVDSTIILNNNVYDLENAKNLQGLYELHKARNNILAESTLSITVNKNAQYRVPVSLKPGYKHDTELPFTMAALDESYTNTNSQCKYNYFNTNNTVFDWSNVDKTALSLQATSDDEIINKFKIVMKDVYGANGQPTVTSEHIIWYFDSTEPGNPTYILVMDKFTFNVIWCKSFNGLTRSSKAFLDKLGTTNTKDNVLGEVEILSINTLTRYQPSVTPDEKAIYIMGYDFRADQSYNGYLLKVDVYTSAVLDCFTVPNNSPFLGSTVSSYAVKDSCRTFQVVHWNNKSYFVFGYSSALEYAGDLFGADNPDKITGESVNSSNAAGFVQVFEGEENLRSGIVKWSHDGQPQRLVGFTDKKRTLEYSLEPRLTSDGKTQYAKVDLHSNGQWYIPGANEYEQNWLTKTRDQIAGSFPVIVPDSTLSTGDVNPVTGLLEKDITKLPPEKIDLDTAKWPNGDLLMQTIPDNRPRTRIEASFLPASAFPSGVTEIELFVPFTPGFVFHDGSNNTANSSKQVFVTKQTLVTFKLDKKGERTTETVNIVLQKYIRNLGDLKSDGLVPDADYVYGEGVEFSTTEIVRTNKDGVKETLSIVGVENELTPVIIADGTTLQTSASGKNIGIIYLPCKLNDGTISGGADVSIPVTMLMGQEILKTLSKDLVSKKYQLDAAEAFRLNFYGASVWSTGMQFNPENGELVVPWGNGNCVPLHEQNFFNNTFAYKQQEYIFDVSDGKLVVTGIVGEIVPASTLIKRVIEDRILKPHALVVVGGKKYKIQDMEFDKNGNSVIISLSECNILVKNFAKNPFFEKTATDSQYAVGYMANIEAYTGMKNPYILDSEVSNVSDRIFYTGLPGLFLAISYLPDVNWISGVGNRGDAWTPSPETWIQDDMDIFEKYYPNKGVIDIDSNYIPNVSLNIASIGKVLFDLQKEYDIKGPSHNFILERMQIVSNLKNSVIRNWYLKLQTGGDCSERYKECMIDALNAYTINGDGTPTWRTPTCYPADAWSTQDYYGAFQFNFVVGFNKSQLFAAGNTFNVGGNESKSLSLCSLMHRPEGVDSDYAQAPLIFKHEHKDSLGREVLSEHVYYVAEDKGASTMVISPPHPTLGPALENGVFAHVHVYNTHMASSGFVGNCNYNSLCANTDIQAGADSKDPNKLTTQLAPIEVSVLSKNYSELGDRYMVMKNNLVEKDTTYSISLMFKLDQFYYDDSEKCIAPYQYSGGLSAGDVPVGNTMTSLFIEGNNLPILASFSGFSTTDGTNIYVTSNQTGQIIFVNSFMMGKPGAVKSARPVHGGNRTSPLMLDKSMIWMPASSDLLGFLAGILPGYSLPGRGAANFTPLCGLKTIKLGHDAYFRSVGQVEEESVEAVSSSGTGSGGSY